MKKERKFKHIFPVLLTLVMVLLSAASVNAKPVVGPSQTLTLYPSGSKIYNENRRIYANANEASLITGVYYAETPVSLKSKRTNIVSTLYRTNYALYMKNQKYKSGYLKANSTGTTTVTYKIAKTTYQQKITVLKYSSPFASLKLGKMNLTSKFKQKSNYVLNFSKYKNKTLKVQYKEKKGWTLSVRYLENPKVYEEGRPTWLSSGDSFKVTKKNSALVLTAYNTTTGQQEQCLILFR